MTTGPNFGLYVILEPLETVKRNDFERRRLPHIPHFGKHWAKTHREVQEEEVLGKGLPTLYIREHIHAPRPLETDIFEHVIQTRAGETHRAA